MMYLNLMSPKHKKEAAWRRLYEKIKTAGTILIVFFVLISFAFLFAGFILEQVSLEAVSQSGLVSGATQDDRFKSVVNRRLEKIADIQNEFVPWSYFVEYIAESANNDIKFSNIEIDKQGELIHLSGTAGHRNSLLSFKSELEESEAISRVIFPIENILKKENVNFNIKIIYNLQDL
jgi:hypothetical protein